MIHNHGDSNFTNRILETLQRPQRGYNFLKAV